jgi:hypothetical protein
MKRKYDAKRAQCVKVLASRYEVTEDTIRKALRGELKSELEETIRKAYNELYKKVEQALS